ncbi:cobalt-precorrin-5B (C(1))-methyltransferase [Chelatococcus sp. SYSU_G07232]|uniref:Cobalt-precorrin-5B C(1)-methyltransferase n=1 Tax=Chelatococcus albus TaxID=3047466 RepID=A0ABT7AHL2_9HYPH|nr:cobalt-precorrin-5B (C(1))-methyltransferase [Chelatococcus sp. SYSU_G07232]MDJ1158843.1 cobalt-precorrin-5B (C(1))-methyltransferase [Chelatococcus sp. SYSU_G07232]
MDEKAPQRPLRRGWTTGTCAAAAARAAYEALVTGRFPDPVPVSLPGGERPAFALALEERGGGWAKAGIVKDAGDDPDVTHGALVLATVSHGPRGTGVTFRAGPGVGTVTRPGLPLPPGEPSINPVPRAMIRTALREVAEATGATGDAIVEIAIPGGEALARKTLNPRLGILGGLSILGTTGIVVPFSCAAWIHSIYRGIDVARAVGLDHVAGATGSTSEAAVQRLHSLPEQALIDMGDFAGGMLKYLRRHPVPRVTIAGGFAKMTKLGQGLLDLHSRAGEVDLAWLAERLAEADAPAGLVARAARANTALQVLREAAAEGLAVGDIVAGHAWRTAAKVIAGTGMALEITVFDRDGLLVGRKDFTPAH